MLRLLKEKLQHLSKKYQHTFSDVGQKIETSERALAIVLKDLSADSATSEGLKTLSMLLGGENE